jgi:hypothetical protein
MIDQEKAPARSEAPGQGRNETNCGISSTSNAGQQVDIFAEINSHTIPELWVTLGLPGEPKSCGTMRSPFREESNPSFSIFDNGHGFKDHGGEGAGGDGVEFVRVFLRTDHAGVRDWWLERDGIDRLDGLLTVERAPAAPKPPKVIQWPGALIEGTTRTWKAFADHKGISYRAVNVMARAGVLRFLKVDGVKCFTITDTTDRAGEIRRMDGGLFGGKKAFPLSGVSKDWLPGLAMIATAPRDAGVFITEGCTDLLAAFHLYTRYRVEGGTRSWVPCALLGSKCQALAPTAIPFVRGRRVRLVPDGDEDGDVMAKNWTALLLELGCTVDVVKLPRAKDLSDVKGEIEPGGLFR